MGLFTKEIHVDLMHSCMHVRWPIRTNLSHLHVPVLAAESPLLETFQNCRGFTNAVLTIESCIMHAH